jgi:hypothetical protein
MIKFTLYKSARAVRTFHATDVHAALSQCPEMTEPKMFIFDCGAYQWVGNIPYELVGE